jgi:hypothetical protein
MLTNARLNGEATIMFLHAETPAQSQSASYGKTSTAEHLFALIDLCELIERHKKFIVNRDQISRRTENRGFRNGAEVAARTPQVQPHTGQLPIRRQLVGANAPVGQDRRLRSHDPGRCCALYESQARPLAQSARVAYRTDVLQC